METCDTYCRVTEAAVSVCSCWYSQFTDIRSRLGPYTFILRASGEVPRIVMDHKSRSKVEGGRGVAILGVLG